ncbi:MAG: hypothetical protein K0T01_2618 [Acidimicrobiia bacterium]|nr:hypothetical protein [Acidimicrobiia bacterium]
MSNHASRTGINLSSLTSLVPQPRHKTSESGQNPWSERFDRILRNEEGAGSNPASSTKRLGQGAMGTSVKSVTGPRSVMRRATRPPQDERLEHLATGEVL